MNAISNLKISMSLEDLETPALVLDQGRMARNIARMKAQLNRLGVQFRPHVKTNKSMDVTRLLMSTPTGPITISTLKEAEYFAERGVRDMLYTVGIAPNKFAHALKLLRSGVRLSLTLDNMETAHLLAAFAKANQVSFEVMIEIDSDGHRSGLAPDASELVPLGLYLQASGLTVKGVMTHAGSSYDCATIDKLRALAEQERAAVVHAAARLRAAGVACPEVSVGSTPTALFAEHLDGVTEVRAGVFVFFDLVMAGIQVCKVEDLALSVLSTVIGHQTEKGWTLIDAGWMAMSRDRGTSKQAVDQGYGLVCDLDGHPIDDLILVGANQEHGIVAHRDGRLTDVRYFPVGTPLRILPNHACATAAQHPQYHVIDDKREVLHTWPRFNGW